MWSCAVRSYGTDDFPLIISEPPTFEWLQKSSNAAGRIFVHLLLPRKPLLLLSSLSPSLFPPPTLHTGTHSSDHWGTRYWQRGSHGWTPPAPPVAAAAAAAQRQTVTECLTPAQSGGGRSPWVPWDSTSSVPLVQCLKVRRDPAQTRGTRTLDSLIQTS